ncbi:hypothetical protein B0E33_02920 [Roseibium algicola]|jgi:hypothetical protein|uniref:DUF2783 domain-containing protein n=1 Tax=Roseibium algicola TaxID=2857014 RepID=A0ABM6HXN0_9HYPH|nr:MULTISPECIES: DUF2783 domain-containing protein [Stappiaceae]MCR9280222.1 DUF2783 domain-containing protein [Paracoccaceae bacterium]AQQ02682.1 hypothetical protein B0E33_02920 [Roseibium aggregatum]MBN8180297.1 DUF2783 domain-containing protein [Roseibium aggregatum]MBO6856822.1 DUF2783 domain-containing protein [Roseibium sp.]NKI61850.1 DUF2783 domain-containing protein [Labrenzia sp. PO1]
MALNLKLNLTRNLPDPDGFYEYLVSSQRHMSDEEANCMNARLILILANQIGDPDVLKAAIDFAANPKAAEKREAA